jgi:hypothetical protein
MANSADALDGSSNANSPVRGRPPKTDALTDAERSKAYRQRRQAEGLRAVKCLLEPDQMLYLSALCQMYEVTISEAVGLAVTALITGNIPETPRRIVPPTIPANSSPTIRLLRAGGTDVRAESPRCEA